MASNETLAIAGTLDATLGGGAGVVAGGAVPAVVGCQVW